MKRGTKAKQIAVRFDDHSYERINDRAKTEHRGLGEFVRHAVLIYIENIDRSKDGGEQR